MPETLHTLKNLLPKSEEEIDTLLVTMGNGVSQTPVSPVEKLPLPVPPSQVMTKEDIHDWLRAINNDLKHVGLNTMADFRLRSFNELLYKHKFTFSQAECAEKFIIWGTKKDFRTKDVLPSYFFPTKEDLLPFADEFVHSIEVEAKEREQQRKFKIALSRAEEYATKLKLRIDALQNEVKRLKNEPDPIPQKLQPDMKALKEKLEKVLKSSVPDLKAQIGNLKATKRGHERLIQSMSDKALAWQTERLSYIVRLLDLKQEVKITPEEKIIIDKIRVDALCQTPAGSIQE